MQQCFVLDEDKVADSVCLRKDVLHYLKWWICFLILRHTYQIFDLTYYMDILISIFHHQDEYGNKMINEYIRELKIGSGSYAKVVSNLLVLVIDYYVISCLSLMRIFYCNRFFIETKMKNITQ